MRLLSALLLGLGLVAPTAAAADARAQLDAFSAGLDGVRGSFVQTVYAADGSETETSRGTLALKAPRQFRWEYEAPFPQLIVADGLNVWVHDVDLEQVTVRAQSSEEAQSPLTVLTDLGLLDRQFNVAPLADEDGIAWLRLTSKAEEPAFASCDLGFAGQQLVRMVLRDHLGQRNELRFAQWERNPALDPALFTFVAPEGTDIVGEPVAGAQSFPVGD
jgi:outer membrane lipoprotein carrier protein